MNKTIRCILAVSVSLVGVSGYTFAAPTVYIPLGTGNQVVAVDAKTDTITASYSGVENAHGLVATPDGRFLIAGSLSETPLDPNEPKDTPNSELFFVHPAHGHVMSTIPVPGWTHHEAITPDGRYVLSTHGGRGYVSVVDLKVNRVIQTIKTGSTPYSVIVTSDGSRAFVSNMGDNTISEIDLETWKQVRTINSGPGPGHMAFSKYEEQIYVANPPAGRVSIIARDTRKIIDRFEVGDDVHGLDINDDGKTLFVSSGAGSTLAAIDTNSGEQRLLELGPAPYHVTSITGTSKVYVSSSTESLIWVVDQRNMKRIGVIELPAGEGHQMAVVR